MLRDHRDRLARICRAFVAIAFASVTLIAAPRIAAASAPAAPSGLSASGTTGQVTLSWSSVTGATSYSILRSGTSGTEASSGPYATGVNTTSYTDTGTGVANGTLYYYEVMALGSDGEQSLPSSEVYARPVAVPTNLTPLRGNAQNSLWWTRVTGASTYAIYRSTTSGAEGSTPLATVSTPTYNDNSLTNNTAYYYQVTARGANSESTKTSEVTATPRSTVTVAPSITVTPGSVTPGNNSATISWSSVTGATSYSLYRATGPGAEGASAYQSSVTSSYTDTGLTNGLTYYYQLTTHNASGESSRSDEGSAVPGAPATPTSVAVAPADGQIVISWDAIPGATSYNVKSGTACGTFGSSSPINGSPIGSTTYTHTGLTNGQAYYYTVCAVNSLGTSSDSACVGTSYVKATGYGSPAMVAGDSSDDTVGLEAAVTQCASLYASNTGTNFSVTLGIPNGTYDFTTNSNNLISVTESYHNFTVDGFGSTFMFHQFDGNDFSQTPDSVVTSTSSSPATAMASGLTIQNLTIDWSRPPFTQGVVTAINTGASPETFDVNVDNNLTCPSLEFPVQTGMPVRATNEYEVSGNAEGYPVGVPQKGGYNKYWDSGTTAWTTTLLSGTSCPQSIRVSMGTAAIPPSFVANSSHVVLRHKTYDNLAFNLNFTNNILVKNVTIYTWPGMGLMASRCQNVTLDTYNVVLPSGSNRLMTTTEDASHFNNCYGTVTVKNSNYQAMGDDAINVHGQQYTISSISVDRKTLTCTDPQEGTKPPLPGDTVEFVTASTLAPTSPVTTATVASSSTYSDVTPPGTSFTITLTSALSAGSDIVTNPSHYLVADTSSLPATNIYGCTVTGSVARCVLIGTRNATVSNNTFSYNSNFGVLVNCEANKNYEGPYTSGTTICNNLFYYCDTGVNNEPISDSAVIRVVAIAGGALSGVNTLQDVTIDRNTIVGDTSLTPDAILLTCAVTGYVTNNVITGYSTTKTIRYKYVNGGSVTGNTCLTSPHGGISIDTPSCPSVTSSGNTGF